MSRDLVQIASEFRAAVDLVTPFPHHQRFAALRGFPGGCCQHASFLLARVMHLRHSITDTSYVWGERGHRISDRRTHGWLECAGYAIDVTADQFPEVPSAPLVVLVQSSTFHLTWDCGLPDPYPRFWEDLNQEATRDFEASCQAILKAIDR